ncbi:MAG: LexA family transcriptional regulator [Candidatus Omnitrophota bacterium]|jgi:transcriptional regulator with XRE-family HTH domain|nr:MAG: LexA family transcriptional regulator [Candidatus Omnitrophota bacterium]
MLLKDRIRQLREDKKLLQKEFAKKLGVSKPTVSAWEQGSRYPNSTQRKKICEFFGISEAMLFGLPKVEIEDAIIPIVSSVGATDDLGRAAFEAFDPPYKTISFKDCKAVVVDSNSMAPIAYKGQKIIYCETEPVHNGDLVFIKLKKGAQLFKRFHKNHDNIITLQSVNPTESFDPIPVHEKEIEFCYKVMGVKF